MKIFITLCVVFVIVYSAATFDVQLDTQWVLFKHTYKKRYSSVEEENNRRSIWETNLILIHKHNHEADLGVHTYTLKMNQFGDMTNEEFNMKMKGLNIKLKDQTNNLNRHTFRALSNVVLPDAIDWRKRGYVTPVKDQGQSGASWAFSATGSVEGQHFANTSQLISLSEQNLVDCARICSRWGFIYGTMDCAFEYIIKNGGIDTETGYPVSPNGTCRFDPRTVGATITSFVDIKSKNETDLQNAIATIGPISVAIDASHASFQLYHAGVYNEPICSSTQLDHAALVVGYDSQGGQDYYIVKNSWGLSWGNNGYIWMSRNKNNQCGIATMASYPVA